MGERRDRPVSRRRYLGGLLTALAAGLAGCSGVLGGQITTATTGSRTGEPTATPASDTTGIGTDARSPTGPESTSGGTTRNEPSGNEHVSPYTRVYRETIGSVVLIRTSSGFGGGGQGSGFVFRDGYVVTNAHVVSNASSAQVRFSRGEWRSASLVGTDPSSDLAVIRIRNPPEYTGRLPLVEDEPPIGTEVVAIGSPYGFEGSLTSGLVSGVNRSIPAPNGYTIPDAIQTGAPVNPGNSGGPLVNLAGRAVGVINSGGGENLAFAISAALVKRVVPSLIENGDYDHAYMGVRLESVTPGVAQRADLDRPRGVIVRGIQPNGPAAGTLRRGDVIVGLGGQRVDTRQQLSSYLALRASPGDAVQVTVHRNGERRRVSLTLGTRPERPRARGSTATPQR